MGEFCFPLIWMSSPVSDLEHLWVVIALEVYSFGTVSRERFYRLIPSIKVMWMPLWQLLATIEYSPPVLMVRYCNNCSLWWKVFNWENCCFTLKRQLIIQDLLSLATELCILFSEMSSALADESDFHSKPFWFSIKKNNVGSDSWQILCWLLPTYAS